MLKNPITISINDYHRSQVINKFPELSLCPHENFLSIYKYLDHVPEKYFDEIIYRDTLSWLNNRYLQNSRQLVEYFESESNNLSKAFQFLHQINNFEIHDDQITGIDDLDILRNIDENIHPVYLRLVEAVFAQLIKPIAYFSRIDRNKPIEGLDVYNLVEEVKNTPLRYIIESYNHTMRNGIAHGGIRFKNNEIEYIDKKENTITLYQKDVIKNFDNIVDVCNSLSLAIKVFLLQHKNNGIKLPHSVLMEELSEGTKTKWLMVEGCVETIIQQGGQLLIYTRPNTSDNSKVLFLSFHIATLAEFLSPGYERYFISIKSRICLPGWIIFKGKELEKVRELQSEDYGAYKDVVESPGLFFIPKFKLPKIIYKLDSIKESFHYQYLIFKDTFLKVSFYIKNTKIHRNSWGMVLSGDVVVELKKDEVAEYIRKHSKKFIRSTFKIARKEKSVLSIEKYLPLGYARVSIYSKQLRKRRLSGYGLGEELICTIQMQRIQRIKSPDIYESQIEQVGKYRIAWNKKWLTTNLT